MESSKEKRMITCLQVKIVMETLTNFDRNVLKVMARIDWFCGRTGYDALVKSIKKNQKTHLESSDLSGPRLCDWFSCYVASDTDSSFSEILQKFINWFLSFFVDLQFCGFRWENWIEYLK